MNKEDIKNNVVKAKEVLMSQAGIASVLSLILPGVGQFYNGNFFWGIFWFIVTPGLWIGTGGFFGWVCHVISSYLAYKNGEKNEIKRLGQ